MVGWKHRRARKKQVIADAGFESAHSDETSDDDDAYCVNCDSEKVRRGRLNTM